MAEALLHNLSTAPAEGKRRRRADHYEVEQIVQEQRGKLLVVSVPSTGAAMVEKMFAASSRFLRMRSVAWQRRR